MGSSNDDSLDKPVPDEDSTWVDDYIRDMDEMEDRSLLSLRKLLSERGAGEDPTD